jgi:hypothetical protein
MDINGAKALNKRLSLNETGEAAPAPRCRHPPRMRRRPFITGLVSATQPLRLLRPVQLRSRQLPALRFSAGWA